MDDPRINEAVDSLEERLKIKKSFLKALLEEDDWSFIIKAHAVVEAAVSTLLMQYIGIDELLDVFSRIELSNKSYGKIVFLKYLNLLKKDERRFISALSEMRNKLVHNIHEIDFSIKAYVCSLPQKGQKTFIHAFGYCYLLENDNGQRTIANQSEVISDPKKSIWLSLKYILAIISIQIDLYKERHKRINIQDKIYELERELENQRSNIEKLVE